MPPVKKRKTTSVTQEVILGPVKRLTDEEKNNLEPGEEIEIDIDGDDTLFTLRKLLDDYLQEKHKNQSRVKPCEIERMTWLMRVFTLGEMILRCQAVLWR
ncbi:hypothetical protein F3Y22_tig00110506pilonHSYRG00001 [Hibiscus syriacus]|uniref:Uncharacterized protein n=1 Tax=Hibiscus syriacus TaxID=106335 RepID=A0A6A3ACS1_HIBSY|nr:hypothetical protein F3Y22_tig00110506pilonHSYRG00001 [Hibiscus syriacus]